MEARLTAGGVALACGCKPETVGLMLGKMASIALLSSVSVTLGAAEGSTGGAVNGAPSSIWRKFNAHQWRRASHECRGPAPVRSVHRLREGEREKWV